MSIFLDPTGRSTFGIGICGRCSRKFFLSELYSDPNSPGLKVCREDLDVLDPYRLPARQPDNLVLPFVRPDLPLEGAIPPNELLSTTPADELYVTQEGEFMKVNKPNGEF